MTNERERGSRGRPLQAGWAGVYSGKHPILQTTQAQNLRNSINYPRASKCGLLKERLAFHFHGMLKDDLAEGWFSS